MLLLCKLSTIYWIHWFLCIGRTLKIVLVRNIYFLFSFFCFLITVFFFNFQWKLLSFAREFNRKDFIAEINQFTHITFRHIGSVIVNISHKSSSIDQQHSISAKNTSAFDTSRRNSLVNWKQKCNSTLRRWK